MLGPGLKLGSPVLHTGVFLLAHELAGPGYNFLLSYAQQPQDLALGVCYLSEDQITGKF